MQAVALDEVKRKALESKTIEEIFTSWHNRLEEQAKSFEEQTNQMKMAEIELYENLDTLKVIQREGDSVISKYKDNATLVTSIIEQ